MSAVKSFALGASMMVIAVHSASGGSIRSTAGVPHPSTGRTHAAPTTLVYDPVVASNPVHHFAAANLAPPQNHTDPTSDNGSQPAYWQGRSNSLSLGYTGSMPSGNWNMAGSSPAIVQNSFIPTYTAPAPALAPAPVQAYTAPAPSPAALDAFINFGNGPYAEAASLTTGNPQSFINSPVFTHLFGPNGPTQADIANFEKEVLSTIKSTYNNAGLPINLTTDPNVLAAHTMSVVSGASYTGTPGAIGITDVGNNGFSFIDKFGGVQTADQLAIAIGHNLSHELMHAFGIADHPEQTGPYVDAATSTLQSLSDPSTGFSTAATTLLSTLNFQAVGQSIASGAQRIDGNQILVGAASTVPESSTVAFWALAGSLFAVYHRRKSALKERSLTYPDRSSRPIRSEALDPEESTYEGLVARPSLRLDFSTC